MYTFVDGHIYFNNNVIKIRYDLILSENNQNYKENEIFDFYFNIFILNENERVLANTPLDSIKSHRFGYLTVDDKNDNPRRLMIIPYLHDHKIYLNRLKINTDYFYTTLETDPEEEDEYNKEINDKMNNYLTNALLKRKGSTAARNFKSSLGSSSAIKKNQADTVTSIIAMNETEHKYYVYTQNGLLINRVDFKDLVNKYGEPVATSSNGLNFILKKSPI